MQAKNFLAYIILGLSGLIISSVLLINHSNNSPQIAIPKQNIETDSVEQKFQILSTQGNSSCSNDFYTSIPSMSDNQRLQGSCCSKMVLSKYKEQIEGLKKYANIAKIPSDPYDIPARLAKELLNYDKTITPTADEQKILDKAVADSPEKGYCCCKCWRWYVYEGLSKYLVRNQHFTSAQITDVLANSDGCGGAS